MLHAWKANTIQIMPSHATGLRYSCPLVDHGYSIHWVLEKMSEEKNFPRQSCLSSTSMWTTCFSVKMLISSITIISSMFSCSSPCHIFHIFMLYCLLWIHSENLTKGSSNNHAIPKPGRGPSSEPSYVGILILHIFPPELSLRQLCPWCFVLIVWSKT